MHINDYIWLYMIIYDYIWLYMIIYDYIWIYVIIYAYIWLYMIIYDYLWLYMIIYDYIWLFMIIYDYIYMHINDYYMIIYDYIWFYMIIYDYIWLYMIIYDYIWLYMIIISCIIMNMYIYITIYVCCIISLIYPYIIFHGIPLHSHIPWYSHDIPQIQTKPFLIKAAGFQLLARLGASASCASCAITGTPRRTRTPGPGAAKLEFSSLETGSLDWNWRENSQHLERMTSWVLPFRFSSTLLIKIADGNSGGGHPAIFEAMGQARCLFPEPRKGWRSIDGPRVKSVGAHDGLLWKITIF